MLDVLDKHKFDRRDENSLEMLYVKVFSVMKDSEDVSSQVSVVEIKSGVSKQK